ncbi:MAG: hypothetical protein PQJ61_17680 [Spirochaetales bacterium]|uniref:DUF2802 domain-containing protein n=1 Tax=Candidatus Thalassospirochaeta sargassi TaxID=3119039 RepID=A0AAJ1IIF8_9SPIO|nr:hypothetical protein [Spirochaetales bacterium]
MYILLRKRLDRLTEPGRITESLAGDLDIILSEINQATERNILVIEDKIKELEDIISIAEKRITLLKKIDVAETEKKQAKQLKTPVAPIENMSTGEQLNLDIPEKSEEDSPAELTYNHLNKLNTMSGMVTPLKVPEKNDTDSKDMKEQIISLYRNGIDPTIIAANVGINRGEVELIISLYTQVSGGQDSYDRE